MTYYWTRQGIKHFLEIELGEDEKTVSGWRCWASLEPAS